MVAGIGLTGAVFAFFLKQHFVQPDNTGWRICYFIGGGLGFVLLLLRVGVLESGMFKGIQHANVSKGNFFMLFNNWTRFRKYLLAILIGLPTWYVIGILITFSKEFGTKMGVQGAVDPGKAVMFSYVAISIGDLLIGFISETDANATIIPTSFPLVGGQPLSKLLAGGSGACPGYSDKDTDNGVVGWWFYLNFPAAKVPWTGP